MTNQASMQESASFSAEQQRAVERIMSRCLSDNCWNQLPQRIAEFCARPENRAAAAALTNYEFKG